MRNKTLASVFFVCLFVLSANAQNSPFRAGYLRLGFNSLGKSMDNSLSGLSNVVNGNLGAEKGYVFEFGHVYYFNKYSDFPVKFGLDWTIASLTYNKLNWTSYATGKDPLATLDGKHLAISAGTKIGPVISYNPLEALVIDLRAQLSYMAYFFDEEYHAYSGQPNEDYFSFIGYGDESDSFNPESFKNRVKWTFKPNFGITVRRKAIGLALDYSPGKVDYYYDATESHGKEKFKVNTMQLKLSFTL